MVTGPLFSKEDFFRPSLATASTSQWPFPTYTRTSPAFASKCRRAIYRLDKANSMTNCNVFFANPRKRTLV